MSALTGLITSFVSSKLGKTKIPAFNQNVGELLTSKTNLFATAPGVGVGLTLLASGDKLGHLYILIGLGLAFVRDTNFKKSP